MTEVKWDGFRAIVSTEFVPELATFPMFGTFDGELVAFDRRGTPDFPSICERILNRRREIPLTYVTFDLLALNGERRNRLEELNLNGLYWQTPQSFEDGPELFEAVCEHQLEGIVAKRRSSRYRPGERGWVKIKNREYWRYEMERESALNHSKKGQRQFV